MAGFDTLYRNDFDDAQIAQLAAVENRIVLTRDRDLLKRRMVVYGCYVRAPKTAAQFIEMCKRMDLHVHAHAFTLCLHCNTPLRSVERGTIEARLPPAVSRAHTQFQTCDSCGRVFWKGSHWTNMRAVLDAAGIR